MAAALRAAGLTGETRGDEWLLVVFDHVATPRETGPAFEAKSGC
ncbi:hypothetical protein [Streptomyces sp. NPDC086989]